MPRDGMDMDTSRMVFLSSDINLNVKLLVLNLDGSIPDRTLAPLDSTRPYVDALEQHVHVAAGDLHLSCQLYVHGQPLGLPERTVNAPGSRLRWNEWVTLPAKYCDLSVDSTVTITLIGSSGPREECQLGSATLLLFSDELTLSSGKRKLRVSLKPSNGRNEETGLVADADAHEQQARLEVLSSRHEAVTAQTDMQLDWLNRPTYAHIEQRQHELSRRFERHFLALQLPEFEHAVHFHERDGALPLQQEQLVERLALAKGKGGGGKVVGGPEAGGASGLHDTPIVLVSDAEQYRDNPALHKHHKLARSLVSAGFAKELKPDAEERRRLVSLVQYPPTKRLAEEERELMWKFRYSLTSEKRALTKMLKCVDWADSREVYHARQLLQQWVPVDVQDLLELLGNTFAHAAPWVREFAVSALRDRATDAQLLSYLLPLVQSIQYEQAALLPPPDCPLAALLIRRALGNLQIANFLHWYLEVERRDTRHGSHFVQVHDAFLEQLHASSPEFGLALQRQAGLVGALDQASKTLKQSGESRPRRIARLQASCRPFWMLVGNQLRTDLTANWQAMFDGSGSEPLLAPLKALSTPLVMPLDPRVRICSAIPSRATVFKSALSPISLTFECRTVYEDEGKGPAFDGDAPTAAVGHAGGDRSTGNPRPKSPSLGGGARGCSVSPEAEAGPQQRYSVMFKSGDDIRQDQLVLQASSRQLSPPRLTPNYQPAATSRHQTADPDAHGPAAAGAGARPLLLDLPRSRHRAGTGAHAARARLCEPLAGARRE